jgi:hypothetical protein
LLAGGLAVIPAFRAASAQLNLLDCGGATMTEERHSGLEPERESRLFDCGACATDSGTSPASEPESRELTVLISPARE